ncbi:type I polyketide synthase [Pseudoxanthomonas yeongjuensis]|nr:type I polyketide synthase [Pseudoxanthomonas yeongjuensis]
MQSTGPSTGGMMQENAQDTSAAVPCMPTPIEIPTDRPRMPGQAHAPGVIEATLEERLCRILAATAASYGVDRSSVLMAGWAVLVQRLSGQSGLVLGVAPKSGLHLLAMPLDLAATATTAQFLAYIGQWFRSGPDGACKSWQVSFAVGMDSKHAIEIAGSELAMQVIESGDGVHVRLGYSTALFDSATAHRYLGYWQALLESMGADAETEVGKLPMIGADERRHLLETWNDTVVGYPQDQCLHTLIEAQVARTPQAIAVVSEGLELDFAELNRRANRLAHHLRALGVRPDDRVGICVERGWRMVVGLLAILKSGGAYVPLDPAYPVDRLAHMLKDSAPKVLLAQSSLEPLLRGLEVACPLLDLSAEATPWGELPATDIPVAEIGLGARNLAYMIYTSGSTGLPKGAMNEHRGIVNRLLWMQDAYRLASRDTVLQKTPFSFDVSVWEFFWPLMTGARLVMARPEGHKDPAYLSALIRAQQVTTMHFVPSMLHAFLEDDSASSCAGVLRQVMCSGEALPVSLAERFHERLPGVELHNLYGPTEAAVDVTAWTCVPGAEGLSIPIGRPIANTRMYVLDAYLEPVPQGVAGELYIGGVQVGRGYLNRDELTAERFVPDPFLGGDARMYRTGDLGRWMPDGNIEYLGRNDFQVKIRGFRIELGEIEARLIEHPQVGAGVVLARDDGAGDLRLVAYYVPREAGTAVGVEDFRNHLARHLPEYMIPALYVRLDSLPVTPNGKLDRRALPEPDTARPHLAIAYEPPANAEEAEACAAFAAVLGLDQVGRHDNFFDLGGNSLLAMRLLERVRKSRARDRSPDESPGPVLSATVFFRVPTPAALVAALSGRSDGALETARISRTHGDRPAYNEPIAIVAMAGRFPGAADVESFWRNLCDGRDTISFFKPDELDPAVGAAERADPSYVAARGIIEGLEQFDAAFFGISPREAELMDPQQRIFLELCWECLERGGYAPDATPGPVGVFAGMNNATYFQHHVSLRPDLIEKLGAFQVMVNNEKDYIATRVAHKLNLTGPAVSTHTACSTSLVAICQAVDSLRAGQCDMALAGAASATCPPRSGYRYLEGSMLSPDGHTRAFDKDARGTVFSDGAAVLLLKRLGDALADGDQVFALIKGTAINNDGGNKASFTAPSSEGQAAVIALAHANAGVSPRSIGYVEAHGTATPLGDPIEIEGLTKAFRLGTGDNGFCHVGSVKSNIGHVVIAAGAAGVIKTAYALKEERIPATAHFTAPNPDIDFSSTPFVVAGHGIDWKRMQDAPRRAGVSSFGVGGTNAHVVMEEAPLLPDSETATGPQLLTLSARTPAALARMALQLADHLEAHPRINLADVAWTLDVGRKAFAHRVAVTASDVAAAVAQLRNPDTAAAIARSRPAHAGEVAFLFPGQGSQYAGMGRELYAAEPHFRAAFDQCAEGLLAELGFDLRQVVFGDDAQALLPTSVMQPAIFSVEYSLASLWMSCGVAPAAMLGHSIGEFVAATLAGVFELADALKLVARRGRLMQAQPPGSMLSVRMPLAALSTRLPPGLSLAAENAPGACVVSGPTDAVSAFHAQLEGEGVACRALHTSHAFHSEMMDSVVALFRAEVAAVPRSVPQMPIISTATGEWLDAETAVSPDYWARHLREPVRFSGALLKALDSPARVLLEVGTRGTLSALARQHPQLSKANKVAVSSLADSPQSELADFRQAAGNLWANGVALDIAVFDTRESRRRVLLPTYAFERQRYWIDAVPAGSATVLTHPAHAAAAGEQSPLHLVASTPSVQAAGGRGSPLIARLRGIFEDASGLEVADPEANFIEVGLDSLMLTQIALQLQKAFAVKVTFRQLMSDASSLGRLAALLEPHLPAGAVTNAPVDGVPAAMAAPVPASQPEPTAPATPAGSEAEAKYRMVREQMQLMSQQLTLLAQQSWQGGDTTYRIVLQQQELMARQLALLSGKDMPGALAQEVAAAAMPGSTAKASAPETGAGSQVEMKIMDARKPVLPGAKLGRSPEGDPAWYLAHPDEPGKFLKVAR